VNEELLCTLTFFASFLFTFYRNNARKAPITTAQRNRPTKIKTVESSKSPPFLAGIWIPGVSISHFANEHPDEPKTPGEYRHQTITDEFPEAVAFPLYDINDHITSRKILKKEASYYGLIVLPSIIRDVSTAIPDRFL
jgi:hypothetical protein